MVLGNQIALPRSTNEERAMSTHRTTTTALLILSLAAAGVPAASARPIDADAAGAAKPAPAAVYSRQDKSMIPATAPTQPTRLPPILAAPKPPQRTALRQAEQQERLAYLADHQHRSARYSTSEMNAYASAIPTFPRTAGHVVSLNGRFDWGDAGIGAAGGIALLMLGLGGIRGASRYRTRHSAALSG
jgi:hypothetical protein